MVRISRFLSLVLRHRPESIGLHLDGEGWASIDELLGCAAAAGRVLTRDVLAEVVRESDKQRFRISDDGERIRANQGHSVEVDLGLAAVVPPEKLFHGTVQRFVVSIRRDGIHRGKRQYVHLSPDEATARVVGGRRGAPVVLSVRAREMQEAKYQFFLSENGVWLTESVPIQYIDFPEQHQ